MCTHARILLLAAADTANTKLTSTQYTYNMCVHTYDMYVVYVLVIPSGYGYFGEEAE